MASRRFPLHLDERRHRVLVDKQMVDRPPAAASLMVRDPSLPFDQQPAAWAVLVDLRPGQQVRAGGKQLLEVASASNRVPTASDSEPSSPTRKIESDMEAMLRSPGHKRHLSLPIGDGRRPTANLTT
jgi:hypothetical protein